MRYIVLLLIGIAAFAAVACGGGDPEPVGDMPVQIVEDGGAWHDVRAVGPGGQQHRVLVVLDAAHAEALLAVGEACHVKANDDGAIGAFCDQPEPE